MIKQTKIILGILGICAAVILLTGGALSAGILGGDGLLAMKDSDTTGKSKLSRATFAGGCFWCMEGPYDKLDGVKETTSGYMGGTETDASYNKVAAGRTQHREVLQVVYDPTVVSYEKLLEIFWYNVDPVDNSGQFCDKGFQYTTAIYTSDSHERRLAEASRDAITKELDGNPKIVTEIVDAETFYPAEDYHQNYYKTNPNRYKFYRYACGRDARLKALWGAKAGGHAQSSS